MIPDDRPLVERDADLTVAILRGDIQELPRLYRECYQLMISEGSDPIDIAIRLLRSKN